MVLHLQHSDLEREMDLRSGQPDAAVFTHRLDHFIEQLLKLRCDDCRRLDRLGECANHRMAEARYFENHAFAGNRRHDVNRSSRCSPIGHGARPINPDNQELSARLEPSLGS
jgi:hypothetical protein